MIVASPCLRRLLLFLAYEEVLQLGEDILTLLLAAQARARLPCFFLLVLRELLFLLVCP